MSGVEAVGLALGAIPVAIEGLKLFVNGCRTMKELRNYEMVVEDLINRFMLAQGIFRHSVELLLIAEIENWQDPGLLDGHSPNWKHQELEMSLRKRLGSDYEGFIRAAQTLNRDVKRFIKKLRVSEETIPVRDMLICLRLPILMPLIVLMVGRKEYVQEGIP